MAPGQLPPSASFHRTSCGRRRSSLRAPAQAPRARTCPRRGCSQMQPCRRAPRRP
uniref:Uncharacterized protein n=1 Tax=Arundo donax TaxID=35708 RepID=A0A0A9EQY7_ARUDO